MKFKTENYRETENMLGWLTCVVNEVKRHAYEADTPSLFEALKIARENNEIGKMKILCRELFYRLEPGDKLYTIPFDSKAEPNPDCKVDIVSEWTQSGKYVHLQGHIGSWGWDDVQIVNPYEAKR